MLAINYMYSLQNVTKLKDKPYVNNYVVAVDTIMQMYILLVKFWKFLFRLIYNLPSSSQQMPFFPTGATYKHNICIFRLPKLL